MTADPATPTTQAQQPDSRMHARDADASAALLESTQRDANLLLANTPVQGHAAPARLRAQQSALTRHLRDPDTQPGPAGFEPQRLAIYRDLLFNNIAGLLGGNFPVIRALLGDEGWNELVRAFHREHRCRTPLFTQIGREFVEFVETRATQGAGDPPFLADLAHYEWVELALQIADPGAQAGIDIPASSDPATAREALLVCAPVVSMLAWPLAYRWPVHRLSAHYQPTTPPDAPTLLLLRREPDGRVRFSALSPLAYRLLQRLAEAPTLSGRAQLEILAQEAGSGDVAAFVEQGATLLEQLRVSGVLCAGIAE